MQKLAILNPLVVAAVSDLRDSAVPRLLQGHSAEGNVVANLMQEPRRSHADICTFLSH